MTDPVQAKQQHITDAGTGGRDGGIISGDGDQAAGMQTMLNSVRATGATNVVVLTGTQWGNNVSQWLAYKPNDPLNNLAAGWHLYNFNICSSSSCYDSQAGTLAAQVPILVTETGADSCDNAFNDMVM